MPILSHDGRGGKQKHKGHSHSHNASAGGKKRSGGSAAQQQQQQPDFAPKRAKLGQSKPKASQQAPQFSSKQLVLGKQRVVDGAFAQWSLEQQQQQQSNHPLAHADGTPALSRRKLSIAELTPQLRHYSANVRRNALRQLAEIIQNHAATGVKAFGRLLRLTLPSMLDGDRAVRHECFAFLELLLDAIDDSFAAIDPETLHDADAVALRRSASSAVAEAFVPLFIRHAAAALTHMAGSVRVDAVAFVSAWLSRFPEAVAVHTSALLPYYTELLISTTGGTGTTGAAAIAASSGSNRAGSARGIPVVARTNHDGESVGKGQQDGSASVFVARISVLSGLHLLLAAAFGHHFGEDSKADDKLADVSVLYDGYAAVSDKMAPSRRSVLTLNSILNPSRGPSQSNAHLPVAATELLTKVLPVLSNLWLESSPQEAELAAAAAGSRSKDSEQTERLHEQFECCILVCDVFLLLLRHITASTPGTAATERASKLVRDLCERHLFVFFPFKAVNVSIANGMSPLLGSRDILLLNLRLSELALLVVPPPPSTPPSWLGDVSVFVEDGLNTLTTAYKRHDTFVPLRFPHLGDRSNAGVLLECFVSLFLRFEQNAEDGREKDDIMVDKAALASAFLKLESCVAPSSEIKAQCLSCVAKVLSSCLHDKAPPLSNSEQRKWLLLLPKILWQLKATHHVSAEHMRAEYVLSVIHNVLRDAIASPDTTLFSKPVQLAIVPLFQGSAGSENTARIVWGPFARRWSKHLQHLLLHCVATFNEWVPELWGAMTKTLASERVSPEVVVNAVLMVLDRTLMSAVPAIVDDEDKGTAVDTALGFMLTLMLRRSKGVTELSVPRTIANAISSICASFRIAPLDLIGQFWPQFVDVPVDDKLLIGSGQLATAIVLISTAAHHTLSVGGDPLSEHEHMWSSLAQLLKRWILAVSSPLREGKQALDLVANQAMLALTTLPANMLLDQLLLQIELHIKTHSAQPFEVGSAANAVATLAEYLSQSHSIEGATRQAISATAVLVREYGQCISAMNRSSWSGVDSLASAQLPSCVERLSLAVEFL